MDDQTQAALDAVANIAQEVTGNSPSNSRKWAKNEWLKPFQFKPGQSGNPSGRPKGKVVTESLEWVADLPYPPTKKLALEKMLGLKLPNTLTMAQGAAIVQWMRAATDTHTLAWITDRLEGLLAQGIDLTSNVPMAPPIIVMQAVSVTREGDGDKIIELEPVKQIDQSSAEQH